MRGLLANPARLDRSIQIRPGDIEGRNRLACSRSLIGRCRAGHRRSRSSLGGGNQGLLGGQGRSDRSCGASRAFRLALRRSTARHLSLSRRSKRLVPRTGQSLLPCLFSRSGQCLLMRQGRDLRPGVGIRPQTHRGGWTRDCRRGPGWQRACCQRWPDRLSRLRDWRVGTRWRWGLGRPAQSTEVFLGKSPGAPRGRRAGHLVEGPQLRQAGQRRPPGCSGLAIRRFRRIFSGCGSGRCRLGGCPGSGRTRGRWAGGRRRSPRSRRARGGRFRAGLLGRRRTSAQDRGLPRGDHVQPPRPAMSGAAICA